MNIPKDVNLGKNFDQGWHLFRNTFVLMSAVSKEYINPGMHPACS